MLLKEYFPIVIFFALSLFIGVLLICIPALLAKKNRNVEKLKAYECGFDQFPGSQKCFSVKFYLIAILFIVFDIEISFLIPWATNFAEVGVVGFWSVMCFLFIIAVGLLYELRSGALD